MICTAIALRLSFLQRNYQEVESASLTAIDNGLWTHIPSPKWISAFKRQRDDVRCWMGVNFSHGCSSHHRLQWKWNWVWFICWWFSKPKTMAGTQWFRDSEWRREKSVVHLTSDLLDWMWINYDKLLETAHQKLLAPYDLIWKNTAASDFFGSLQSDSRTMMPWRRSPSTGKGRKAVWQLYPPGNLHGPPDETCLKMIFLFPWEGNTFVV